MASAPAALAARTSTLVSPTITHCSADTPSFCAACYRKERTGETFMNLAKPGTIKGKCSMNAMVTLKEYLDDFASPEVKSKGYKLIGNLKKDLDEGSRQQLSRFLADIDKGVRDAYV